MYSVHTEVNGFDEGSILSIKEDTKSASTVSEIMPSPKQKISRNSVRYFQPIGSLDNQSNSPRTSEDCGGGEHSRSDGCGVSYFPESEGYSAKPEVRELPTANGDDKPSPRWALSPTSTRSNSGPAEVMFASPPSSISTEMPLGFSTVEIRVETGLIGEVPPQIRISPNGTPCAIFALIDAGTKTPQWFFAKEYTQLANFNDLIHYLLTPFMRRTGFRLREFPSKEAFLLNQPWKVDVRNDMLNAYFKSLSWLNSNHHYRKDKTLRNAVEQALQALILHDKVEPSSIQSFGLFGEEMMGFMLSQSKRSVVNWDCRYYRMNGSFLDIVEDLSTGKVKSSICLHQAYIEQLIVLYEPRSDNARYAINLYETTRTGKKRLHTLCAENEKVRQQWMFHLRRRVSYLAVFENPTGFWSQTITPALPYVKSEISHKSPYLSSNEISEISKVKKNRRRTMLAYPYDYSEDTVPRFARSSESSSDRDLPITSVLSDPSRAISNPVPAGTKDRDNSHGVSAVMPTSKSLPQGLSVSNEISQGGMSNRTAQSIKSSPGPTRRFSMSSALKSSAKQSKQPDCIFGVMPSACKHQLIMSTQDHVPSVVARCLRVLYDQNASEEIGIFRISGAQKRLDELEAIFNLHGDYDMLRGKVDVHTTADLLKRYLRKLPEKLITNDYPEAEISRVMSLNESRQIEALRKDVSEIEPINCAVLKVILRLIHLVSTKEATNAMGVQNLSVALSPSIRIPRPILEIYIREQKAIFE